MIKIKNVFIIFYFISLLLEYLFPYAILNVHAQKLIYNKFEYKIMDKSINNQISSLNSTRFIERIGRIGGPFIHGIAVGDLNGDGKKEIVAGDEWGKVRIYSYNGDTFVNGLKQEILGMSYIDFGGRAYGMAIGDLNGDSKPELYIGTMQGLIYVLIWNSSENKYVQVDSINIGDDGRAFGMSIGDVNGNGKLELVCGGGGGDAAEHANGVIHIFDWNGSNYSEIWSKDLGNRVYGIAIGDVDNDGLNEILTGEENHFFLIKWNGNNFDIVWTKDAWYVAWSVAIADVDNDSTNEMITSSLRYGIDVYGWDGNSFIDEYHIPTSGNNYLINMIGGDLDRDGNNEMIIAKEGDCESYIRMYKWTGTSYVKNWEEILTPTGLDSCLDIGAVDWIDHLAGLAIDDVNNDGKKELIVGDFYGDVIIYSWEGSNLVRLWSENIGKNSFGMKIGDFDNDGKDELAAGGYYGFFYIYDYENSIWNEVYKKHVGRYCFGAAYGISYGDLNGDGLNELVVCGENSDLHIFKYIDGEYTEIWGEKISNYNYGHLWSRMTNNVRVANVDEDSYNEIAVGDAEGMLHILGWNGIDYFEKAKVSVSNGAYRIAIGDLDMDGINEIAVGTGSGKVGIIEWKNGAFVEKTTVQVNPYAYGLFIGDVNNDNINDLVIGDGEGVVSIYDWDNNTFTKLWSQDIGTKAFGILAEDLNNDNLNELILGNEQGQIKFMKWIQNDFFEVKKIDVGSNTFCFDCGDINRDGKLDVVAGNEGGDIFLLHPEYLKFQSTIVWPGDNNNNGIVNEADLLPIGLAWELTGSARPNASNNWVGQPCPTWAVERATYADANGDGIVNESDIQPIGLNWGNTHNLAKSIFPPMVVSGGNGRICPILDIQGQGDKKFYVDIQANNVNGLFGIAFQMQYPQDLFEIVSVKPGDCWSSDRLFYFYKDYSNGNLALAVSQIAGQSELEGTFTIARITMKTKSEFDNEDLMFDLSQVVANNSSGEPLLITADRAIFKNNISRLPHKFNLYQNYPNPFNSSTIIKYELPEPSKVKIKIYNALGNEIAVLVNENKDAGEYKCVWDGRDRCGGEVSSGIYFYAITTNSFSDIKKCIFLK